MQKGDIVLISFPFTNLQGAKRRPAVILSAGSLDVIVCFITSKVFISSPTNFIVNPEERNGLKKVSAIKVDKIATLDKELIKGKIGELSTDQITEVNLRLKNLLRL